MLKFDTTFLRSKVARRMFVLFVFCALLPVGALAILSLSHVTRQLDEQSGKRLSQSSRAMAINVSERLLSLEN